MTNFTAASCVSLALLGLFPSIAKAQAAGPRDYLNTPVNAAAIFSDFIGASSETAAESDLPLPNNEAIVRNGSATILYSFPLDGRYAGVTINGGGATVKVKTPFGNAETSGVTDPSIAFHANIFGLPALRAEQFRSYIPRTFLSFHLTVNAPLGSYDRNSPVNAGSNRWAFTPLMNLDVTPDRGTSWFDFYAGGRFFTTNNSFQGNNQLTQAPLGIFTVHYSHNIGKKMWAAIGVYYDVGGQTFINGIPQHDAASGFRPSVAISRLVGRFRFTLRYDNTASTPRAAPRNGLIDFRISTSLP
jgi:hypothetical protein